MTTIKAFDAMSQFHVFSILAASLRYKDVEHIEIELIPGLNGSYCLPELQFLLEGRSVRVVHGKKARPGLCALLKLSLKFLAYLLFGRRKQNPKYILMHHTYIKPTIFSPLTVKESCSAWVITFEEGVGTYGDLSHHLKAAKLEKKKFPVISHFLRKFLSEFSRARFSVLDCCQPSDAQNFQKSVLAIARETHAWEIIATSLAHLKQKDDATVRVIIFGSPFVDLGCISTDTYRKYIRSLLAGHAGCHVFVKPHPLEEKSLPIYRELGASMLEPSIGGEVVIDLIRPTLVIGFHSGSLLVARNVYKIPFSLIPIANFTDRDDPLFTSPAIRKLYQEA